PYNRNNKPGPKPKDAPRTAAKPQQKKFDVLTNADWLRVFKFMDERPDMTQIDVAKHFSTLKDKALIFDQSTLSRRLKKRSWIKDQVSRAPGGASAKRECVVTCPEVDHALALWVKAMDAKNETVSGKMLVEKRRIFEERMAISEERRLDGTG
ncbi:hypothetical protein DFP72DRAFT_768376, partial [Ephemerocybe angulata]